MLYHRQLGCAQQASLHGTIQGSRALCYRDKLEEHSSFYGLLCLDLLQILANGSFTNQIRDSRDLEGNTQGKGVALGQFTALRRESFSHLQATETTAVI